MPLRKKPLPRKRTVGNIKENTSELNPAKFKDYIEVLGKAILGIVAFWYATGILVESLYLGSFGVYHVSIFRFTYVLAGVLATIIFMFPIFPVLTYIYVDQLQRKISRRRRYGAKSHFIGAVIFSEAMLVFYLQIPINFMFFSQLLVGLYLSLGLLFFYNFCKDRPSAIERIKSLAWMFIAFAIGLFLFSLGFFSTQTFPQISARYGGGKPLTVQLLLEVNKQNSWMIQKNFDLCDNDKIKIAAPEEVQLIATKPMPLLLTTDTDYIIRKDENTAVSITRDQVKTVLYLDNVDPNKDVCADPTTQ